MARQFFIPAKQVDPNSYVVGFRSPRLAAKLGLRPRLGPVAGAVGPAAAVRRGAVPARSDWSPEVIGSAVPYPRPGLGEVGVNRFDPTPVCGDFQNEAPYDLWPSQTNMRYERMRSAPYGRQLRGLGAVADSPVQGDTWAGSDPALRVSTQQDDVAGNGIFDGDGTPATANGGYGMFESRYSLPGYVHREKPGHVSEVVDRRTGNPVMYLTAGGGTLMRDFHEAYDPHIDGEVRGWATKPVNRPFALPAVSERRSLGAFGAAEAPASNPASMGVSIVAGVLLGVSVALGVEVYKKVSRR